MIVQRGQIERTTTGPDSELGTPLKTGAAIALLCDMLIVILHVIALCVWIVVDTSYPIISWWAWFSSGWWLSLVIPFLLAWPASMARIVYYRLDPETRNRNWPPTYLPLDPVVGLVDAYNSDQLQKKRSDVLERMYRARGGEGQ